MKVTRLIVAFCCVLSLSVTHGAEADDLLSLLESELQGRGDAITPGLILNIFDGNQSFDEAFDDIEIVKIKPGALARENMMWVRWVDENRIRTRKLRFTAQKWMMFPFARVDLEVGDPLTEETVTFRRVDGFRFSGPPCPLTLKADTRMVSTQSQRSGSPILKSSCRLEWDIAEGQPVQVQLAVGNVTVVTQGVAQASGRIGERIPVKVTYAGDEVWMMEITQDTGGNLLGVLK